MKILAVDTSTKFMCLGICDGHKIYVYNLETQRKLSSLLSLTIKRVFDALGWELDEIDYLACGLGPGSFTGLRVGIATVKGISWALHKPIAGVSTLDILAGNAEDSDRPVVPVIDAKRGLIYTSVFKKKNGRLRRIRPYMLLDSGELIRQVPPQSIIFGDALGLYKERLLGNINGATFLDKDYWYPKAHNIIELARERIKEVQLYTCFNIKPIYLYPKECQIKGATCRPVTKINE